MFIFAMILTFAGLPPSARGDTLADIRAALVAANRTEDTVAGLNHVRKTLAALEALDESIESTKINREMVTTEVRWTDRVATLGTSTLLSMYTGHAGRQGYWPVHAVTWHETGPHFAALVRDADQQSVDILVYNFEEKPKPVEMRLWQLRDPGTYRMRLFEGDHASGDPVLERTVTWRDRGDRAAITLPSRKLVTLVIDPVEVTPSRPTTGRPDPAVSAERVKLVRKNDNEVEVVVTVLNLSPVAAESLTVRWARLSKSGPSRIIAETDVAGGLPGMSGLDPVMFSARMTTTVAPGRYAVSVETPNGDVNPANNHAEVMVQRDLMITPAP